MSSTDLTGHVTPGGPGWRLDLGAAVIDKCSVSTMDNNVYLISCIATGERLLVDAAADPDRILGLLDQAPVPAARLLPGALPAPTERLPGPAVPRLGQILTTHQHWDHHRALAEVARLTGADLLAGDADADALPVLVQGRLAHGDTVRVGSLLLQVIALRGHTPGSVALALEVGARTVLFTGDSLFPGGPGKTPDQQAFTSLMDDLEARIFDQYADDTLVLPGHGDNTTLGQERPHLRAWRARGW